MNLISGVVASFHPGWKSQKLEIINITLTAPFLGFSPSLWVWVEVSRPTS